MPSATSSCAVFDRPAAWSTRNSAAAPYLAWFGCLRISRAAATASSMGGCAPRPSLSLACHAASRSTYACTVRQFGSPPASASPSTPSRSQPASATTPQMVAKADFRRREPLGRPALFMPATPRRTLPAICTRHPQSATVDVERISRISTRFLVRQEETKKGAKRGGIAGGGRATLGSRGKDRAGTAHAPPLAQLEPATGQAVQKHKRGHSIH